MKSATITDVARRAGVSKSTVSAVLNDKSVVRESTRLLVLRVMEELHYRPSPVARRGFRARKDASIAVVIREQQDPFCFEAVAGIQGVAAEAGYVVSVLCSQSQREQEQRIARHCLDHDVGGLVFVPTRAAEAVPAHFAELKRHAVPFVLLDGVHGIGANQVEVDNVRVMARVVNHLLAHGHSRILHLAGPAAWQHSHDRAEGFRRAMRASPRGFDESLLVGTGWSIEQGYRTGRAFFAAATPACRPTAVTCYNDLVAIGLLRALRDLEIRVPEDVSVVGFDDLRIAEYLAVPLTTVRVPRYEMGRRAAELLIRRIEATAEPPSERIFLNASLVVRDSTRSLRGAPGEGGGA